MDVKEKIQDIIRDVTSNDGLELYDDMTEDDIEDYDSMTHIDTMLRIEEEMHIKFTPEEIVSSKDMGSLIKMVEDKM